MLASSGARGAICSRHSQCKARTYCDPDDGKCKPGARGMGCGLDYGCQPPDAQTSCDDLTGKCVKMGGGSLCRADNDCSSKVCSRDMYNGSYKCVPRGSAYGLTERACESESDCQTFKSCDDHFGKCVPGGSAVDVSCNSDSDCKRRWCGLSLMPPGKKSRCQPGTKPHRDSFECDTQPTGPQGCYANGTTGCIEGKCFRGVKGPACGTGYSCQGRD